MLVPPPQLRSVDPFSEDRFSSVLNRYTRIYTGGRDVVLHDDSFLFVDSSDSTAGNVVTFSSGSVVKDDVLIEITENTEVDFENNNYYLDETPGMVSTGWYYVVLWYNYVRTYPPPSAFLRILRDKTLFTTYQTNYIFLAAIEVVSTSGVYSVNHDTKTYTDPTAPTIGVRPTLSINWWGS